MGAGLVLDPSMETEQWNLGREKRTVEELPLGC